MAITFFALISVFLGTSRRSRLSIYASALGSEHLPEALEARSCLSSHTKQPAGASTPPFDERSGIDPQVWRTERAVVPQLTCPLFSERPPQQEPPTEQNDGVKDFSMHMQR